MNLIKNKYINYYLLIIFLFSVFNLFEKHTVGNDSTISEWLINYEGGFTKRGLIGQISIIISNIFKFELRESILFFQIVIIAIYYLLLVNFFSKLRIDKLILFTIFSPIFVLYPVAEIEVLARKEYFIFIFFLIYLLLEKSYLKDIYKITVLPLSILIWEPVAFFFSFWFLIDFMNDKPSKFFRYCLNSFVKFLPALLLGFYIAVNPISEINHLQMTSYLKNNFNENCYMSCALLLNKSSIYDQFYSNFHLYSFEIFLRYGLIILIGFGPLLILISYLNGNKLNKIFK